MVCVCVCVRVCERERERVCGVVWWCVRERESVWCGGVRWCACGLEVWCVRVRVGERERGVCEW